VLLGVVVGSGVSVGVSVGVTMGVSAGVSVGVLVGVSVSVDIGVLVGVFVDVGVGSAHETVFALCLTNSHSEVPKVKTEPSPQATLTALPWSLALKYVEPVSLKTPS
jgi:hypothetical protein